MVMEGDVTWDGEHTIQYTDDVLQNCTPGIPGWCGSVD